MQCDLTAVLTSPLRRLTVERRCRDG